MITKIETGFIHQRDYGISIGRRYDKFFFTPFKYALATLMLENREQIEKRFENFAMEHKYNLDETKTEFRTGVKKKEKNTTLIDLDGRDFFNFFEKYGKYAAEVISKSKKKGEPYKVSLDKPSFINRFEEFQPTDKSCDCDDFYWTGIKNRLGTCIHSAGLELALYLDNKNRLSQEQNITRLFPKERPIHMEFPFEIGINSKLDLLLTDTLWQYYVENRTQAEINEKLLENPHIYSQSLVTSLNNPKLDRIKYEVLRQKEKEKERRSITETEKRFYGASKALEERIYDKLDELGFTFRGYGLEFKGTKDQIVAKRFENKNGQIMSVCVPEEMPPIMIKKILSNKSKEFPFQYNSKPLKFTSEYYEDIDDMTRRNCDVKIFIPGEKENSDIFVAQNLKERYRQLKERHSN